MNLNKTANFSQFIDTYRDDSTYKGNAFSSSHAFILEMEKSIQNRSRLLSHINIKATKNTNGKADFFDISQPIASKTDTNRFPRTAKGVFNPSNYQCEYTNYDIALPYALIDSWVNNSKTQEDFNRQAKAVIERRIALDRTMVAFNGIAREKQSDLGKYPRLEDINIGWLETIRRYAPGKIMERMRFGQGETHRSLGHLLRHAAKTLLQKGMQDDPLLVAIIGADLLPNPIEKASQEDGRLPDLIFHQQRQGGMQAASAAFFPADSVLITRLDNLSLYFNANSYRAHYAAEPEKNQTSFYQETAEAFVIENLNACALLEEVIEPH